MLNRNYDEIDSQLAALGEPPSGADLSALVQRHAGEQVTLANVDALLDALGQPVAMPPRLQPTVVDVEAPSADAAPEPATPDAVFDLDAAPEPAAAEDAFDANAASEPPLPTTRGHFPWDSEPPLASIEAQMASDSEPSAPPPPRAPDLESLFNDDPVDSARYDVDPALHDMSRPPRPQASGSTRPRHDTMEHMPAASVELASMSALDLSATGATGSAHEAAADSGARESGAPEVSLGSDDADEFEILVDDEILEIDEDELSDAPPDEPAER